MNKEEAFNYYLAAAYRLSPHAKYSVAYCYAQGSGVEQNEKEAFNWFSQAADTGLAQAQCAVARCYEYGYGVEQDSARALTFYSKAADKGLEENKRALEEYKRRICAKQMQPDASWQEMQRKETQELKRMMSTMRPVPAQKGQSLSDRLVPGMRRIKTK
jgi:TPR repeat protein